MIDDRIEAMHPRQIKCHARGHSWPEEPLIVVSNRNGPGERGVTEVRITEECVSCGSIRYQVASYPSFEPTHYGYRYMHSKGYLAKNEGRERLTRDEYKMAWLSGISKNSIRGLRSKGHLESVA